MVVTLLLFQCWQHNSCQAKSLLIPTSVGFWEAMTASILDTDNLPTSLITIYDTWEFLVAPDNNDLICINKHGTEFHILNANDNYQHFWWQSGINLSETGQSFQFALAHNRNLFLIKKSQTGTNSTEAHILTASSGHQVYRLQTGTTLPKTDHTSQFLLASNDGLFGLKNQSPVRKQQRFMF